MSTIATTNKSDHPLRIFAGSVIFTVVAVILGWIYGGPAAALLVLLLSIFELSFSIDNALLNAKVVEKLSPRYRFVFLTFGIAIAVFGMRLIFPLLIVGAATGLNPFESFGLAMEKGDPETPGSYGYILHSAHPQIAAFGGMFLLMLFLNFIFEDRDIKWLSAIEKPLAAIGKLDIASVVIGLGILLGMAALDPENSNTILLAGILGVLVYLVIGSLGDLFEKKIDGESNVASHLLNQTGKAAIISILYLEVLDSSLSFDSVIGGMVLSTDPIILALGLGSGAFFVRSITIFLVKKGTMRDFVYLEHGAHWAIGILAIIIIISVKIEIPEVITGLAGIAVIGASLASSIVRNKREAKSEIPVNS